MHPTALLLPRLRLSTRYKIYSPIRILNDDILLHIFYVYLLDIKDEEEGENVQLVRKWDRQRWWYKPASVCRRWRQLILASTSLLDLHLLCTYGVPIADMLAHSPPLPLTVFYDDPDREMTVEDEEGVLLALSHCDRLQRVALWIPATKLVKLTTPMNEEFPILERMCIEFQYHDSTRRASLKSFRAPNLRHMSTTCFPITSPLPPNTTSLVNLELIDIPASAYFPPRYILTRLSHMPQLETLVIHFYSPLPNREVTRQLSNTPFTTNVTLPHLHVFSFRGVSAYLEGLLSRIIAPSLNSLDVQFFNQLTFTVPRLLQFMQTSERLSFSSIELAFYEGFVDLNSDPRRSSGERPLRFRILCRDMDWQVATAAQLLQKLSPLLSAVEEFMLSYQKPDRSSELHNIVDQTQWREIFRPLRGVKKLCVPDTIFGETRHTRSLRLDDKELFPNLLEVRYSYNWPLSLTQGSFSYLPTLETQHSCLISMREHCDDLPSNYASKQVDIGQLNRAIETLERGRGLLWSEMRSFRTSADHLAAVNLALAEDFVAINSELEQIATSVVPYEVTGADGNGGEGPSRIDLVGALVAKRQKLLEDREELISRIRALPGFDNFLKPPSFDALRSAALRGPVIIINHCNFRSDILILFHNSPPSLITTPHDFYDCALKLGDQLAEERNRYGLDSREYNRMLRFVLKELYVLVGRPVIDEFHKVNIPEQSRVWWCPTSVFCHLPLHAMGPILSDEGVKLYFSDLYISSYTPTLSTLIESRRPGGQAPGRPSILLVAQPESLRYSISEIDAIQRLDTVTKVTSLISKTATPSSVVEALRHHHFFHFVCTGNLVRGKPLDASFQLYGNKRLTLLDIVRCRLPRAEFAFLSACHTAMLTEDSIDDEALHLTAAMQYCGFRSVVGTMWAMADEDGQYLAKDFYKSIFSSDEPGVAYYERSARALRDAVQNLRRRGVPLERWVNFVHYGA